MSDIQVYDPVMGRSVKNGSVDTCSKCGHTIPEEHVSLICWDKAGTLMWVYCEKCEGAVFHRIFPKGAQ